MERIWLKIIVVMICGDIIKLFADSIILRLVTDIVVFIIAAVMLGKDKLIDRRKSFLFLSFLTLVIILQDANIISALLGNGLVLAGIIWLLVRRPGRKSKPKLRHQWHK